MSKPQTDQKQVQVVNLVQSLEMFKGLLADGIATEEDYTRAVAGIEDLQVQLGEFAEQTHEFVRAVLEQRDTALARVAQAEAEAQRNAAEARRLQGELRVVEATVIFEIAETIAAATGVEEGYVSVLIQAVANQEDEDGEAAQALLHLLEQTQEEYDDE